MKKNERGKDIINNINVRAKRRRSKNKESPEIHHSKTQFQILAFSINRN